MKTVIALSGGRRMGKDTVADHLVSHYGFQHIKITGPLKLMLKEFFGMSHEQLEGSLKETLDPTWGVSPRHMMQFVGTEMFQYKLQELVPHVGREFWVRKTARIIEEAPEYTSFVISDLRFLHEHEVLSRILANRGINYHVVAIRRSFENRGLANATDANATDANATDANATNAHVSEQEFSLIPYTYLLENDSTLQDLYDGVDVIMKNVQDM